MEVIYQKHCDLHLEEPEKLQKIAHALSSPVRLAVLRAISAKIMSVGEIAQGLDIPMSTAALAVKVLEEAGIITTETQSGTRGTLKLCSRKLDNLFIDLVANKQDSKDFFVMNMPIGGYSGISGVKPTCGMATANAYIGEMDNPSTFYLPERLNASLLWFRQGTLEYRFSTLDISKIHIEWMEISFEVCSEAPLYRNPWKSDIVVSVNDKILGKWTSPCDCGGRRGRYTPKWWSEINTQYGFLKTFRVDDKGSYVDNIRISDVTIHDLNLEQHDYIALGISAPRDAENRGGLNLFGKSYGDYEQDIVVRVGYDIK